VVHAADLAAPVDNDDPVGRRVEDRLQLLRPRLDARHLERDGVLVGIVPPVHAAERQHKCRSPAVADRVQPRLYRHRAAVAAACRELAAGLGDIAGEPLAPREYRLRASRLDKGVIGVVAEHIEHRTVDEKRPPIAE